MAFEETEPAPEGEESSEHPMLELIRSRARMVPWLENFSDDRHTDRSGC